MQIMLIMMTKAPSIVNIKMRLCWVFVLLLSVSPVGSAEPATPGETRPAVVHQATLGKEACVPCSLFNALNQGGAPERAAARRLAGTNDLERVRTLIAAYGKKPSVSYPGKSRYEGDGKTSCPDMLAMAQDACHACGLRAVEGSYMERARNESGSNHLRRIHALLRQSLDEGFPPVVQLVSFSAVQTNKQGYDWRWEPLMGHAVCILEAPRSLGETARGFVFHYADSDTGQVLEGYLCEEKQRSLVAARGDGWRGGGPPVRPYLFAVVPDLPLDTPQQPWYLRTAVAFTYAVFRR